MGKINPNSRTGQAQRGSKFLCYQCYLVTRHYFFFCSLHQYLRRQLQNFIYFRLHLEGKEFFFYMKSLK